jgi:beta propeller repeat protein
METARHVRAPLARVVLFLTLATALALAVVAPAGAARHAVRRTVGDTTYSMSWSGQSLSPFRAPTSAPGLRTPSVDGKLVACRTGSAKAASGFDVVYKTLGGGGGTWGGPGDQTQPSVAAGLIAGVDRGAVAVFDPATHTATPVSDAAAVPASPAFAGGVVVWQDHRGADWDIYGRRVDPLTGAPTGDVFAVCTATGDQTDPAVDGSTVVWQDHRGAGWDISGFDLTTQQESPVCAAAGDQTHPDVADGLVVWQDHRRGQWDIWSRDLATKATKALCADRGAQTSPAVSDDLVVWQAHQTRVYEVETASGATVHRYHTPVVMAYSRAAGQSLHDVMDPYPATGQVRPAVSGSLVLWEDTGTRLPRGATRIYGATIGDLWAYGCSITPGDPYVSTPDVTFHFDVAACPHPPVAQVSVVVGPHAWRSQPVWQPFAAEVPVHLSGGDGRTKYEISFQDSAGDDSGSEGSMLILDTHGPSCWAPYPMTVKAGATATLRYKVTDALSEEARATVTVLRKDGTVALALPARYVPTGRLIDRHIRGDLPAGKYTVSVTATDMAGNPQVRAGTTTLTVK